MGASAKATLVGSTAIGLWGTLALLTRMTEGRIPPFQLLSMTFTLAFLLMLARWAKRGHGGTSFLKQPVVAWLLGVGGLFGYHFFYFIALAHAPVIEASLIAYLWPLLIVLFASALPGERLKKTHLAGALLALAGCWLLVSGGSAGQELSGQYIKGYLSALLCAFIWSIYSVASRLVKEVPTDAVAWFCAVTALSALLCHWLWETTVWPETVRQWLGVIGLGIGPLGVAFFTWDYGVKHGNLPLLGVLSYATPLISTALLIIAGEAQLSILTALACAAIVGGCFCAGRSASAK